MDMNELKNFEPYKKRVHIIYNLLKTEFQSLTIHIIHNEENNFYELFIQEYSCTITILPDSSYKQIKLIISKKEKTENTCKICEEETKKKTTCSKCGENWCIKCYCSLLRTGQGLITCPFCRFEYGRVLTKNEIEKSIRDIQHRTDVYF